MTALSQVYELSAQPLCSTAFALAWKYDGSGHAGFEIDRQQQFDADQSCAGSRRSRHPPGVTKASA